MAVSSISAFAQDEMRCREKDGDLGIAACTRAIQRNPRDANLYYFRGIRHENKGDFDRALADYTSAIKRDPKHESAFENRGNIYLYQKREYDRAIADFDQAIKIEPNIASAFSSRGAAYAEKNDIDRAVQDYSESIRLTPIEPFPWYRRGLIYFSKTDYQAAARDFESSIKESRSATLSPNPLVVCSLYLARLRSSDQNARRELETNAAALRQGEWGTLIARMYLGLATPDQVLSNAPIKEACRAQFYVAHWHQLRNDKDRAVELFTAVAKECTLGSYGYEAKAELARIVR